LLSRQACDWGEYVKFEEVEARIATLAAEVERLKATYNTMVKGYEAQLATARADALREAKEALGDGGMQALRNLAEQADRVVSVTTAHIGYQAQFRALLSILGAEP